MKKRLKKLSRLLARSKGFTLVEAMVVIVILGIIIAIAVPQFGKMQRKARIRAAAEQIAQDFRQIRERALGQSGQYEIISPDANHYQVIAPNGDTTTYLLGSSAGGQLSFGNSPPAAGNPVEDQTPGPGAFDFPGNTLYFMPRGGTGPNWGVAYITDGSETYAVGVNNLGKIRVYKYRAGWVEI